VNKKLITIIISIVILSTLIYGLIDNVNNFVGEDNPFNVTFTGNQNKTEFIDIPLYADVKNFTITIQGFELT